MRVQRERWTPGRVRESEKGKENKEAEEEDALMNIKLEQK